MELEKSISFKNILVATDFSEASRRALECATAIAGGHEGQLFILHAMPSEARMPIPLDPLPVTLDRPLSEAQQHLEELKGMEALREIPHEEVVERGPVVEVVTNFVRKHHIDLLIVGTHGRTGLKKLVLGSVSEELFRSAPCPVLTVGPSAEPGRGVRRVLFATDFGHASRQALPYAIEFANKRNGELILLHLVPPMPVEYVGPFWYPGTDVVERQEASQRKAMQQLRELLPSDHGLTCHVERVVENHLVPEGIPRFAAERNADLIVLGIKESGLGAPRLTAHMPWATAHDVVCRAHCPVLTIRA
jgi:nucleotide-binding universal stress UspA family protein